METKSLNAAINLVNGVKHGFANGEGVYERFLEIMKVYGQGLVDIEDVRVQFAAFFENNRDLLYAFLVIASGLKGKRRSVLLTIEKFERNGSKGIYDRGRPLFIKIWKRLSSSAFMEFLRHCRSYGSEEIERSELIRLVAGVLGDHRRLLDEFDELMDCYENKSPSLNKRKGSPIGEDELSDQPDRPKRQRVTPSYYLSPLAGQGPALEDDHLLNECVTCVSAGYNCSRRVTMKSKEERLREDYEDKRCEVDVFLGTLTSAAKAVEKLNKIVASSQNPIPLEEHLQAKDLRCIERLYGDHGIDLLQSLHDDPRGVLPVIVPRLQQKLEGVKEWARTFSFEKYSLQFVKGQSCRNAVSCYV